MKAAVLPPRSAAVRIHARSLFVIAFPQVRRHHSAHHVRQHQPPTQDPHGSQRTHRPGDASPVQGTQSVDQLGNHD